MTTALAIILALAWITAGIVGHVRWCNRFDREWNDLWMREFGKPLPESVWREPLAYLLLLMAGLAGPLFWILTSCLGVGAVEAVTKPDGAGQ